MKGSKKFKWNSFGKLQSFDDLRIYFDEQVDRNTEFNHYTSLAAINAIIGEDGYLRISSVNHLNDKFDREQFCYDGLDNRNKYYILCFFCGVHENLSLWYMYGGMDGKGGRIRLTKRRFDKLLEQARFVLCEFDYEQNCIGKMVRELNSNDYVLSVRDIVYFNDKENRVELKYNTQTNFNKISSYDFKLYQKKYPGFSKKLIWYYEKERRILLELTNSLLQELDDDKEYIIKLLLGDEIKKYFNIDLAPAIDKIAESIQSYENIKTHLENTSKIGLSKYHGEIDMNFCGSCSIEAERRRENNEKK